MIDTHCHIKDKKYESEINDIVLKAIDAGVKKIICVGVDLESSEKSIQIANNPPTEIKSLPNCPESTAFNTQPTDCAPSVITPQND